MRFSLPRSGALGTTIGLTTLALAAAITPAQAQPRANGPFYTAQLAQPTETTRAVAGGVAWNCQGSNCAAPKGTSRPLRMCRELKREVGQVTAFTANGETLSAEDLARCNG